MRSIFFRGKLRKTSPPATNIKHRLPGSEAKLATNKIKLCFLRLIKIFCVFPIGACVGQTAVEHPFKKIVADIVVSFADLERLPFFPKFPTMAPR